MCNIRNVKGWTAVIALLFSLLRLQPFACQSSQDLSAVQTVNTNVLTVLSQRDLSAILLFFPQPSVSGHSRSVVHDVPVTLIPSRLWAEYEEPPMPRYQVSLLTMLMCCVCVCVCLHMHTPQLYVLFFPFVVLGFAWLVSLIIQLKYDSLMICHCWQKFLTLLFVFLWQFSICLPPLKTLRHVIDRLKNLSNILVSLCKMTLVCVSVCLSVFVCLCVRVVHHSQTSFELKGPAKMHRLNESSSYPEQATTAVCRSYPCQRRKMLSNNA